MKKIIYFILLLLSFSLFAQPPGGGSSRNGGRQNQNQQNQENRKPKQFKASEAAGVFYYDIDEVLKKIKIKDDKKQYSIRKALKEYNFKVKEISFLNSEKFSELDIAMKSIPKSRDNDSRMEMRKRVEELIRPIRKEIHQNEIELNKVFESLLSPKQKKKWLKYQKKKKQSLKPKKPENRNNQNSRQNSRRGGQQRRQ